MLLSKGKVAPSEPWKILEVSQNQQPDVLAIRLSKELKRIHEAAVQLLVPFRRNSDGEPEWIVEHVYCRGANGSLSRLARTPGIDFIRKEPAPESWIQQLLHQEQESECQAEAVSIGQFVRILTGPCARLCGNVTREKDGTLTVTVTMRTKNIRVFTLPANLQPVTCPDDQKVFFYQPAFFS